MKTQCERIGDATLYLADALEVLSTISRVDAVITDPPYAIPTQVASGREITRNVGDLSLIEGAFRNHISRWKKILGKQGRAFIFCDGASYSVIYRAAYGDFNLASIVWDKGRIGMGREFRKQHELIIHAWGVETPVINSNGVGYSDVITRSPVSQKSRNHPAEKPIELIEDLLRVCGKTVLDPFMGSGTTGVACARMKRRFIGIEIERRYFDTARRRIEEAYRKMGE